MARPTGKTAPSHLLEKVYFLNRNIHHSPKNLFSVMVRGGRGGGVVSIRSLSLPYELIVIDTFNFNVQYSQLVVYYL